MSHKCNPIPGEDHGYDLSVIEALTSYTEPAEPLPVEDIYTYSRENMAEEWHDIEQHEGVIDAEKYGDNFWSARGRQD